MKKSLCRSIQSIFLIMLLFALAATGQNTVKTYHNHWKTVDDFQNKGLPKSALEEVRNIYQKAKKEKNNPQLIKAAIYMAGFQPETNETGNSPFILEMEKEVNLSQEPVKSVLTSVLAGLYLNHYNRVRWNLYNRTQTTDFKNDDFATWGTKDFHEKIRELYLLSIKNEKQLQLLKLEEYGDILVKGNTPKLRPTLYDLLTHEALKYFSSDERDIQKPAYSFAISSASAFEPAADFVNRKFESKDSASLQLLALRLYQSLIAFHLADKNPDALIDVDVLRLQYVSQKSVHPDKNQLYRTALNHIVSQYPNFPAAAQASYLIASSHFDKAMQSQALQDTTSRFETIKAALLCEQITKASPDSEGGINASNLLSRIREKTLQFSAESVNLPNNPFRVFVTYKNISKLHLRLIKATETIKAYLNEGAQEQKWNLLTLAPIVRRWEQTLPDLKDYQAHSVEVNVDALPIGEYVLLAGTDANFDIGQKTMGARLLSVSEISFVQRGDSYFVLNRNTGQPLSGAEATIWTSRYDAKTVSYQKQKRETYTSNVNGYFVRKKEYLINLQSNETLEITYQKDTLITEHQVYTYYNSQEADDNQPVEKVFLFTDRSLYRPGQVIHYKGIARKGNEVLKDRNKEIVVTLNSNGKEIEKTIKKVNEYGSFSGQFTLPAGQLNGLFTIEANEDDQISFHVEDYKRPKFEVSYDTLKGTYKVNDTIKIAGNAVAYAGNAISGAKVSYRVVRNSHFPYLRRFSRGWFPPTSSMEITNGTTVTDNGGKFSINFKALPDLSISQKLDPVFNYTIYADITDSNGETRSGQTTVSVSYKSLLLKNLIPEKLAADSLKNLAISTENMNGMFLPREIKVKVTKLLPETRLIRPRYWGRPDVFVMSKEEYIKSFPNDEYDGETEFKNWPEADIFLEKTAQLSVKQKFDVSEKMFLPGFYKIEISTGDPSGEDIRDIKYIELTDPKSDRPNQPQYLYTEESKPIEPGERTSIKIGSSADDIFLIINVSGKNVAGKSYDFSVLNIQSRTFVFTATEKDRGGYGVNYVFVKNNRVFQFQETIRVPWTNKDLKIEYASFRDKTLPGSQEKWKVKISGYKTDKVAAEMLGSMYDISLDQFYKHQWRKPFVWASYAGSSWTANDNFSQVAALIRYGQPVSYKYFEKRYDQLLTFDFNNRIMIRGTMTPQMRSMAGAVAGIGLNDQKALEEVVVVGYGVQKKQDLTGAETQEKKDVSKEVSIRKNFNETAFFLPDLQTNKKGEIEFSFTMPDALTRWKFQALAHTKDLAFGYSSREIVTQKDLMVQPNPPRFLREGDKISFSAKVVNLTDKVLTGTVNFQLFDTETNKAVDDIFQNLYPEQNITLNARESKPIQFSLQVPLHFTKTLTWRIVAKAGSFSDGEEKVLPVLSNRMLVTESMPLPMSGKGSRNFRFEKLINSGNSKSLVNESLTVEYTSNPAWYAVQALPTLMEFKNECAEQTWNGYYANSLAALVANSSSKIRKVFDTWKTLDTTALQSNLEKNQELKSVLLEEMPWLLTAKSETEQKRNIGLLFDMVRMSRELSSGFDKLKQSQNPDGGFVWFKGGTSDRYMTQYITTGIGHLKKINAIQKDQEEKINSLLWQAIGFLDLKMKEEYNQLIRNKTNLSLHRPSPLIVQYLYMRSFFPGHAVPSAFQTAHDYFLKQLKEDWVSQTKFMQGMIALTLHRSKDKSTPKAILKSLKETAIVNEETGMTWETAKGWWWYQAPIERQALLIEAFDEISNDTKTVDAMRTWLLKNKQTNHWESSKATAEACYAMLLKGTEWLSGETDVQISLGDLTIKSGQEKQEAGTGYLKKTFEAADIKSAMGNIKVDLMNNSVNNLPSWGAVYWQYFEDLDKITFAETPLKIAKKLFIEKNSDIGPVLSPVNESTALHVGDKIKVRIELRVDRDMEYVHMKDMRASAIEPVNVLSGYKWQGGLGYYESTKDAGTNFFFNYLQKGTYVFEYSLFVTHDGDFSNGITTVQCMYAPEFTAHSEGVRIQVK
ncbi:alpha-2-macroglobulin family protein [Dyadobacter psychrotolerans]|uniref:Alpha-2-macroglobulin n=1 Tax=Dyadobacter psychrotolerans TaxID=2541721 RepID=A0A4R5DL97_9BACT|nr:alpha-2-macroglobulin family protein [Dyadobacter psychrotolerans]TDE12794.1 alpha-2-macroglobulin [Dyadobacter psychrotolerans]